MLIFYQTHGAGCLPESVRCAKFYVRDIAVICDKPYVPGVTNVPVQEVDDRFEEFDKVYRHHAFGTPEFQKICIKRWFAGRRALRLLGIDRAFFADSDCLVCCEPLEQPQVQGAKVAVSTDTPGAMCTAGMSLQTQESLDLFEKFAFEVFFRDDRFKGVDSVDMWMWTHLTRSWGPGIELRWKELNRVMDGCVWDHHLGVTHGFKVGDDGGKELHFRDHFPFTTTAEGEEVRLCGMHCWARFKPRMAEYNRRLEE